MIAIPQAPKGNTIFHHSNNGSIVARTVHRTGAVLSFGHYKNFFRLEGVNKVVGMGRNQHLRPIRGVSAPAHFCRERGEKLVMKSVLWFFDADKRSGLGVLKKK